MNTTYEQTQTLANITHMVAEAKAVLRYECIQDHRLAVFLPATDFPGLKDGQVLGLPIVLHDGKDVYVGLRAARVVVERKWVRA